MASSSSPSFSDVTQLPPATPPSIQQSVRPGNDATSEETSVTIKQQQNQQHMQNLHSVVDPFWDMDSKEYTERYNKIEADYRHRLMAKYFSDKDIFGDSVFDEITIINGETIKSSRVHCAQSYADPVQYLKDKKSKSSSPEETQTSTSNDENSIKKDK